MIKIGYNPDFAPFSIKENDRPGGIVIERLIRVFENTKLDYELIPTGLTSLTRNLMDGTIDAVAALAITPSRYDNFSFSKPMIVSGGAWFIPSSNENLIEDEIPNSVITPKVGPLVNQIKDKYPEIDLKTCEDYDAALIAALAGEAGAAALNWHVGRMLVKEKFEGQFHIPKAPFNTIPLAVAVTKNDPKDIIDNINKFIPDDWGFDPIANQ